MTSTPESAGPGSSSTDREALEYRSLEHRELLASQRAAGGEEDPDLLAVMHQEFPDGITEPPFDAADAVSRRGFLGVVAASAALAGLTSCRKPKVKILPFNQRPEGMIPGVPRFYATAHDDGGYAIGTLVRSSDGRPTKIEGNPLHPVSRGKSTTFMQGELIGLYDPARARGVAIDPATRQAELDKLADEPGYAATHAAKVDAAGWKLFDGWLRQRSNALVNTDGQGLAVLMPPTTSPSTRDLIAQVKDIFPQATVHHWQPLHRDVELEGSQIAFGRALDVQYDLEKATRILTLDADILGLGQHQLPMTRGFARSRRVTKKGDTMSRLYALESCYTITGAQADHRWRLRAGDVSRAAVAIGAALGISGTSAGGSDFPWLQAVVEDLQAEAGRAVVIPGPSQPAAVHALCHAINNRLGSIGTGKVVNFTATDPGMAMRVTASIAELAAAIEEGQVKTLLCLGCNPAYDAPADLDFGAKLAKVPETVYLGHYRDETAAACAGDGEAEGRTHWFLPMAHSLEAWHDLRATDGTLSIAQPLIEPLHGGRTPAEILAGLIDHPVVDSHGIVRRYWEQQSTSGFAAWWDKAVHDGVVADTAATIEAVPTVNPGDLTAALNAWQPPAQGSAGNMELVFAEDAKVRDGRYANNPWLQELPHPMTKLTWDNAALMSRTTASALGVTNGDLLEIEANGRKLEIAAWILPGHADWTLTLPLGYGRNLPEDCTVARNTGFNTYALRTTAHQATVSGAKVSKTGGTYPLVTTQDHGTMAGRDLVRSDDINHYNTADDPRGDVEWFAPLLDPLAQVERQKHGNEKKPAKDIIRGLSGDHSLWKEREYTDDLAPYQWAMTIDLNTCTGCNACVVACVAENNIPSVGKTQVGKGREMHWIRIDRYFQERGASYDDKLEIADDPEVSIQPVPCMQCENAPCESVCPVAATVHSPEGLNDMAYNRCIGTRYCSNNCPYKVRRFNWFDYRGKVEETTRMAFNPDVTMRSRGVMEKCTYCVQRINTGKLAAKLDGRRVVRDGEIKPACAQSCPAEAITFGNLLDRNSEVATRRERPTNYGLLSQLNTRPRTTYLARFRNRNPQLSTKNS